MKKIALLEDHEILRNLTSSFLEEELNVNVEPFMKSHLLLEQLNNGIQFDLLIIDLSLEFGDGFEILDNIKSLSIKPKVIVHTSNKDAGIIKHCIELKANGVVSKSSSELELLNAIEALKTKSSYYCPKITSILNNSKRSIYNIDPTESELTKREREVIKLMWNGNSSEEISELLSISYYTVESHRKSIKKKLGGQTLIETLRIALEKGYIDSFTNYTKL